MPKKLSQKGFGLVEGLLIVIAVALVAFVGYYIYHTQKTANDTLSAVAQNNSKGDLKAGSQSATKSSQNYFTLTEWGVQAPYSGSVGLSYRVISSDGPPYAKLSSKQLDVSDAACASAGNYGGVITRYASTDTVQDADGSDSGKTPAEYIAAYFNTTTDQYAHIGNYYYLYVPPQGACGSSQASQAAQTATVSAFRTLIPKLKAVSN